MSVLNNIKAIGIPTDTPVAAIQEMRDYGWFEKSGDEYGDLIISVTGVDAPTKDERELNYTFRYVVTTAIENPGLTGVPLVAEATDRARKFIANHAYVFATPDEDETPKVDAMGKPKAKKGAKKEHARKVYDEQVRNKDVTRKDAIAILVAEVGLSPAGASTYYANLKKGVM